MARRKSFIAAVVVAAIASGIVAVALTANGKEKTKADGRSTPPPPSVTYTENEWKIVTPAGWTQKEFTLDADAEKAVRYEGPNGEYFIVAIDPLGSDYTYDALWTYKVKGNGFEVSAKQDCVGTVEQGCSTDDQRFSGYVMWKTGTSPKKVGGHVWYFQFGNSKSTTIDGSVFEQILESIQVQG